MSTVVIDRMLIRVKDIFTARAWHNDDKKLTIHYTHNPQYGEMFELESVEARDRVLLKIKECMEYEYETFG